MGRGDFAKLHFPPSGNGGGQRRSFFSRFELYLLVPLTVFGLALAIFSTVYILRHKGTVKPVAIAAICFAALLLAAIAIMVLRRLRKPEWLRDLESGTETVRQRGHLRWSKQPQFDTKGLYAVVAETRPQNTNRPSFVAKIRLAVRKTINSSLLSRNSIEPTDASEYSHLGGASDSRFSTESTEEKMEEGLWMSVFELAGDQRLDQLRRDNLKRLSRESRRSRYEMSAIDDVSNTGERIHVTVTKPEPTATPPRSRRGSLSRPGGSRALSPSVKLAQSESGNGNIKKHHATLLALSPPPSPGVQFGFRAPTKQVRGLRRLPSPDTKGCQDLRAAFKKGVENDINGHGMI